MDDEQVLRELNVAVGEAENRGDAVWLADHLAPRLAFQRADPLRTVDDAATFLGKVRPGGDRVTRVETVQLFGDRAVVTCVVSTGGRDVGNVRLWVRRPGGDGAPRWPLLGWANEPG